ncbi:hypothetical protein HanPSC8_Chr02g0069321 [Helianthus annuus]|nr:hypothetical protein HanPSC8_Chr02g0069321 [Helianthus annuus]
MVQLHQHIPILGLVFCPSRHVAAAIVLRGTIILLDGILEMVLPLRRL